MKSVPHLAHLLYEVLFTQLASVHTWSKVIIKLPTQSSSFHASWTIVMFVSYSNSLKSELAVCWPDHGLAGFSWMSTTGLICYGEGEEQDSRSGNHPGNR